MIRESTGDDVAAIEAIYADHALDGLASFEGTLPRASPQLSQCAKNKGRTAGRRYGLEFREDLPKTGNAT